MELVDGERGGGVGGGLGGGYGGEGEGEEERFDGLGGMLADWVGDEPSLGLFSWFELPASG